MYSKKILRKAKTSIVVTFASIAAASLSLNLIPYIFGREDWAGKVMVYVVAAVFWIGLLLAFAAAGSTRRTLYSYREIRAIREYIRAHQRPGIIRFSRDWRMLILYGVTAAGLVLMAADIIFNFVPEPIMFPVLSVTILLFAFHCILDGKYYKAYKQIKESVNHETNP